jgi:hypothetical protein
MMDEEMIDTTDPSDLMFNPWADCKGRYLSDVAQAATSRVLEGLSPAADPLRFRKPSAAQRQRIANMVACLVANLANLHRDGTKRPRMAVPMKHEALTRYDRKGFRSLPEVVRVMETLGLVVTYGARPKIRRTGLAAAGWLREALLSPHNKVGEVGEAGGKEILILAARSGRGARGRKLPSTLVDYADTEETLQLRAEIEEINAFLATQRIELDGEPQAAIMLTRRFMLRNASDPHRFNLHGRLYGGFWQSLPARRRPGLTINGEQIADLDYASMFPRLAYAKVGAEPPEGDLYAIPGLEAHRGGAKIGLSALLSAQGPLRRLPGDLKAALPPGWTAQRFRDAVAALHPALVPLFGRDVAADLMLTESRILIRVLSKLIEMKVGALPMHDGIMVSVEHSTVARFNMLRIAQDIAGVPILTVRKI